MIQNHFSQAQQKNQYEGQKSKGTLSNAISLLQKKHYGICSKIFCCKCFYCCQDFDFSLLTSKHRKYVFENMVKKYLKIMHNSTSQSRTDIVMDPFFILVALMLGEESQIYNQLLEEVSNSQSNTIFSKEDLEFYIPQLCTYLVFHEQMSNVELSTLLEKACRIDLHFSLRYYFFMKSLQMIDSTYEIKKVPIVEKYNKSFRNKINLYHKSSPKIKRKSKIPLQKPKELKQKKNPQLEKNDSDGDEPIDISLQNLKTMDKKASTKKKSQIDEHQLRESSISRKSSMSSGSQSSEHDQQVIKLNNEFLMNCREYNREINEQSIIMGQKYNKIPNLYPQNLYQSVIHETTDNYPNGLFESTARFFSDLVQLSETLVKYEGNRQDIFKENLKKMNNNLPAHIYVPFTKPEYQDLNILNILIKQSKVFKTKQRAPFKISFEAFSHPLETNQQSEREKKVKSTIKNISHHQLKRSVLFQQDIILDLNNQQIKNYDEKVESNQEMRENEWNRKSSKSLGKASTKDLSVQDQGEQNQAKQKKNIDLKQLKKNIWNKVFELKNRAKEFIKEERSKSGGKDDARKSSKSKQNSSNEKPYGNRSSMQKQKYEEENQQKTSQNMSEILENSSTFTKKQDKPFNNQGSKQKYEQNSENNEQEEIQLFGQSEFQIRQKMAEVSPYSKLKGYKIVSFIVKSNDDLRQECFAMQLLQEFQRIFKMQKLKINLSPYQVLPLSHNSGVIEFISQAVTIDQMIKKKGNLLFVRNSKEKMHNFISSLAGYSLVTYFLQVKDRHNANIMVKRDGSLIHIDFGFFLSNMPGKGVELEKNVPFKLTNQYVQALGGTKSKEFSQFRKIFYQGFNALRKHQHRVIILTKLMYSSYGTTMKCFEKGDEAVEKFVKRFNPKKVYTDGQLSLFCQQLINASIQNWRAKWYDRWQYFAQGILY